MKQLTTLFFLLIVFVSCKKYEAEYTYAKPLLGSLWAKNEPFYTPKAEVYIDSLNLWRSYVVFAFTYDNDPDKLGFANPYNPGKGTNPFYMRNFYTKEGLTSDSPYYNITIPKALQLVAQTADNTEGIVKVIPQKVTIYRRDKSAFDILLLGGEGTFSTKTQLLETTVIFNETSIGGPANITRRYRFRP
ncbi:MAG: hypothetical protein ACOVQE_09025 [Chitinophagaceae bacterium]